MPHSLPSDAASLDAQLERALRDAVLEVYKNGELENLTVKRIRRSVEEKLELEEDFFKYDERWKDKSKAVIQSEVHAHGETNASSQPQPPSPAAVKPREQPHSKPRKPPSKSTQQDIKRPSVESADTTVKKKRKKRKKSTPDVEESASKKEQGMATKPVDRAAECNIALSSVSHLNEKKDALEPESNSNANGKAAEGSESEMSDLLDEDPNAKKQKRRKSDSKSKAKNSETSRPKKLLDGSIDAGVEEIKRLQNWLVKCGIRKMWYRELAPYDSSKAKIRHLKDMLAEVGMTGRYSKEKADQIREERELKADLEAVQEGEKAWGKSNDGSEADGEGTGRPRRRLARGLQDLDFLNDDDGEETD